MKLKAMPLLLLLVVSCKGTGSTYDPIVENKDERYYSDLQYCQEFSQQRRYIDGDMGNSALAGSGMGGLIGAFAGSGLRGVAAGAVIGSGISAGSQALKTSQDKKYIIVQCLRQRGHNVIM